MQLRHEDKSVTAHATKLSPAAEAAYDRNTANLTLTDAERNEIGRRVALAAEGASQPWMAKIRAAGQPTKAEAAALASAQAAYDSLLERREAARDAGRRAEEEVHHTLAQGGAWRQDDPRAASRTARAQAQLAAADEAVRLADVELDFAAQAVGRAVGAISANGAYRQRLVVRAL